MTALVLATRPEDRELTSTFLAARPQLVAIARRVLRDGVEAEDVVQEAWLRWRRADRDRVLNAPAFLSSTTTRLAINVVRSARSRRETTAGGWVLDGADQDGGPEPAVEVAESVDAGLRLLLTTATPAERGAYLLRAAFDYPYRRIGDVLHVRADHARQLVRRAHQHLRSGRRRPVDAAEHRRLVRTFLDAARSGDLADLERLLAAAVPPRAVRRAA